MPRNLELKASANSLQDLRDRARRAGAEEHEAMLQEDTYYRVASGRLKLRVINGRDAELISYHRPEEENTRLSAYDKTPIPDPETLNQMLADVLGVLAVVRKRRELFLLNGSRIHLDAVEGLGDFIEFEVPVSDPEKARQEMMRLQNIFAVKESAILKPSYSDIVLGRAEAKGNKK